MFSWGAAQFMTSLPIPCWWIQFLNMSVWIKPLGPLLSVAFVSQWAERRRQDWQTPEITQTRCHPDQQKWWLYPHQVSRGHCDMWTCAMQDLYFLFCCSLTVHLACSYFTASLIRSIWGFFSIGKLSNILWTQLCQYLIQTLVLHERGWNTQSIAAYKKDHI